MILMKITTRVTKHGKDPLGRYAWQEILLDGEQTLMIVTAYQVVQRQTKGCGPTTLMMQQWWKLRDQGMDDPKPRQQLLDNLCAFLKPHEQAGNKILLMMDANDPIGSLAMDKFMSETNPCNLMADFLPPTPPKMYQRRRHKIDHIVGTMGINLAMIRAYIIPFGDDSPRSDHVICRIDFSMDLLLCGISAESLYDPTHPSA
jgi:hypothetical protein